MTQYSSNAVAIASETVKPTSKGKRVAQMTGAVALSMGMIGAFGLPANAVAPEVSNAQMSDFGAPQQVLETVASEDAVLPATTVDADVAEEVLEQERKEKEAKKAAAAAKKAEEAQRQAADEQGGEATPAASPASNDTSSSGKDVPAGKGASAIVSGALAQVGVNQDCTDLVQNSLAAAGIIARRDQGGYDLGTSTSEYVGLGGTQITSGDYAPGDVLIWDGRHVAIYIGNGQAVHGGYGGNQTVVASAFLDGSPSGVVRFS
ncbi:MAG: NlpC/P60 family protein [Leucobacter sp.]